METVKIFDTWVRVPERTLHFDVVTTDEATALALANQYVAGLGYQTITVTAAECQFCHVEPLALFNERQQQAFRENGGFIVPLPA